MSELADTSHEVFSALRAAEEPTATAYDGTEVISALARANDFTKAFEQMPVTNTHTNLPGSGKKKNTKQQQQAIHKCFINHETLCEELAQDLKLVNLGN